jgi:Lysylphosphatidylglycerol synthase TM region
LARRCRGGHLARRSLLRPSWRLLGAAGYLAFDIAALGAMFAAAGHPLPVAPWVLGYLIGYLANLVPVPGGFGVLEGGLAGALIVYGAPATQATAAVIVYHAIAFWIPSLGGLLGYVLLRRRGPAHARSSSNQTCVVPTDTPQRLASAPTIRRPHPPSASKPVSRISCSKPLPSRVP